MNMYKFFWLVLRTLLSLFVWDNMEMPLLVTYDDSFKPHYHTTERCAALISVSCMSSANLSKMLLQDSTT